MADIEIQFSPVLISRKIGVPVIPLIIHTITVKQIIKQTLHKLTRYKGSTFYVKSNALEFSIFEEVFFL